MVDNGRPRTRPSPADPKAEQRTIEQILERISSREKVMQTLWERMDKDYSRWRLDKFQPLARDGIANEDAYTSNEARNLADKISGIIGYAPRIVRIEEDSDGDANGELNAEAERLAIGFLRLADERLEAAPTTLLQPTLAWHTIVRGGYVVARALLRKKPDESTVVDVMPIDPRHLVFQKGMDGPIWAAIVTMQNRAAIRDDWDFTFDKNTPVDEDADQMEKVVDYYWRDKNGKFMNAVIIPSENRFAKKPADTHATTFPIIIRAIGANPGVANFDITSTGGTHQIPGIEDFGESIYGPNRGIYDMDNRVRSYVISLIGRAAASVYKTKSADGEFSLEEPPEKSGQVVLNSSMEQDVELLDMPQVTRDVLSALSFIESDKVSGGIPPSAEGVASGSQSGRALTILNAVLGDRAQPGVVAVQSCLNGIIGALMGQYETGGYNPVRVVGKRLDNSGFNREIPPESVQGHGPIRVQLVPVLPEDDQAKWQMAGFAKQTQIASDYYIQDAILKIQDPLLERQRMFAQLARTSTPRMLLETQLEAAIRAQDMNVIQFLMEERQRLIEQQEMEDFARKFAFAQAMSGMNPVQTAAGGVNGASGGNGQGSLPSPTNGMQPEGMPLSGTIFGPSPGANDPTANAGVPRESARNEMAQRAAAIGLELA